MSYRELTKDDFESFISEAKCPVMVDFWASWCNPCRMLAPIFEELSDEYEGKALFGKVNVDEQQELAQRFRVMSIPAILLFKDGELAEKSIGLSAKEELAELLDKSL